MSLTRVLIKEKLIYSLLVKLRSSSHLMHKHWWLGAGTIYCCVQTLGTLISTQVPLGTKVRAQGRDLARGKAGTVPEFGYEHLEKGRAFISAQWHSSAVLWYQV